MFVIRPEVGNSGVCLGAPAPEGTPFKNWEMKQKTAMKEEPEDRAGHDCGLLSLGQVPDHISCKHVGLVPAAGGKKKAQGSHTVWAWGGSPVMPAWGDHTISRWHQGQVTLNRSSSPRRPARQSRICNDLESRWVSLVLSTGQRRTCRGPGGSATPHVLGTSRWPNLVPTNTRAY